MRSSTDAPPPMKKSKASLVLPKKEIYQFHRIACGLGIKDATFIDISFTTWNFHHISETEFCFYKEGDQPANFIYSSNLEENVRLVIRRTNE